VDDETLRREEEELQRVLALSAAEADPMKGFRKSSPSTQHRHSDPSRKDLPSEPSSSKPSRVRALFDFEGQTAEELPLRKGEEVRVLEEVSKDWWRGESLGSGRQGIFPTNYIVHSFSLCLSYLLPPPAHLSFIRARRKSSPTFLPPLPTCSNPTSLTPRTPSLLQQQQRQKTRSKARSSHRLHRLIGC
jgi:hypothetical protein